MKTSPSQRSLAFLRSQGWTCAIVEHWNAHIMRRQDLYGFGDVLCCRAGSGIMIVQTTSDQSSGNSSARRHKIIAEPRAKAWLEAGARISIHAWAKRGERGKRKLWTCREVEITLDDFSTTAVSERALETTEPFL